MNTLAAPAAALCSWLVTERVLTGKTTLVGACTGALSGMIVITPACGFVETWAAMLMGIIVAPIVYWAIAHLKRHLGYDDALDVFGCHCVSGIVGVIMTGVFCVPSLSWNSYGGLIYTGDFHLLGAQLLGILVTVVFVGVMSFIIGWVIKRIFKGDLSAGDMAQQTGLDNAIHGESAYPAFNGLDQG
jgi:Amt family ammonium transporter